MQGMTTIDLAVIVIYLIGMLLIGVYFTNKIKGTSDFYVAGRSLGLFTMLATVCATIIGGGALIGRGGIVYSKGVMAIWLAVPYFLGMIGFSIISGRIHDVGVKYNIVSIPDLMKKRYGRSAKLVFSLLIAYTMMATVGSQISATATIIKIIGYEINISYEFAALIATCVFIFYTSASGLFGVVYTDMAQFIILLATIYILLPIIAIAKIGGIDSFLQQIPSEMWDLHPNATIIGYTYTNLLFSFAGAEMWQRAFASKNREVASKGMLLGTISYGATIISTLIIGLCAYILLPNLYEMFGTYDAAVPALVISCLPVGITGLACAGLLAVLMSSSDSYLLVAGQTIIGDIIREFKPDLSEKVAVRLSRIFIPILGFGALIIALYIRSAYEALMFAWTFYAASVGIPAFAALYWKKATRESIIASVISGFVVSCVWSFAGVPFNIAPTIVGSLACLAALLIVSAMTYKEGKDPILS